MPQQADFPPPALWTRPNPRARAPRPRAVTSSGYLEVYKGRGAKPYRWRERAGNHRIIDHGQGYTRWHDAERGARRASPGVPIFFLGRW